MTDNPVRKKEWLWQEAITLALSILFIVSIVLLEPVVGWKKALFFSAIYIPVFIYFFSVTIGLIPIIGQLIYLQYASSIIPWFLGLLGITTISSSTIHQLGYWSGLLVSIWSSINIIFTLNNTYPNVAKNSSIKIHKIIQTTTASLLSKWSNESQLNTLGAIIWTVLFYFFYCLSFLISLAIPLVMFAFAKLIDTLLFKLTGLEVSEFTRNVTTLAVVLTEVIVISVYIRVFWRVFFNRPAPIGYVTKIGGSGNVSRIHHLVSEVTIKLEVPSFSQIEIIPVPTAGTHQAGRHRVLRLGWLILFYLTEDEVKAIVAHEAAHHDKNTILYHRVLWRLSKHVEQFRVRTDTAIQAIRKREEGNRNWLEQLFINIEVLKLAKPLAETALAPPGFFVDEIGRIIEDRLHLANHRFEFYCDQVAAKHFSSDALCSALSKVAKLNHTYTNFQRRVENPSSISSVIEAFDDFYQAHPIDSNDLEELYNQTRPTHPAIRDRLENVDCQISQITAGTLPYLNLKEDRYHFAQLDWQMTQLFVNSIINLETLYTRALDAIQREQYPRAINYLSELVNAWPQEGTAWGKLGISHYLLAEELEGAAILRGAEHLIEARQNLNQALELEPNNQEFIHYKQLTDQYFWRLEDHQ